jgi:hypothetical protein
MSSPGWSTGSPPAVIRGRRLRVDTTVVERNIHYPTDSTLLADQVVAQTRARVLRGDTHPPANVVSLLELHAEIIRKGKLAKPTEFGRVVKIQEAEAQFITDYEVCESGVCDRELWDAALDQHIAVFVSLEVDPERLNRVELRRIRREPLHGEPVPLAGQEDLYGAAFENAQERDQATRRVAFRTGLGEQSDPAPIPAEGQGRGHRQPPPVVEGVPQDRRLAPRRPHAADDGLLRRGRSRLRRRSTRAAGRRFLSATTAAPPSGESPARRVLAPAGRAAPLTTTASPARSATQARGSTAPP